MRPEDIDNLFRQSLDDHATPPPPPEALWARLQQDQQTASDERLDALFLKGLAQHATPPPRELWERLEDEHLRPRPQRLVAAWWPRALAAVVALLLVAGSVGLWTNGRLGGTGQGTQVASLPARQPASAGSAAGSRPAPTQAATEVAPAAGTSNSAAIAAAPASGGASQKNMGPRATSPATPASTPSNATVAAVAAPASRRQRPARRTAASQTAVLAQASTAARSTRAADEQPKPEAPAKTMVAAAPNQLQAPAPAVASSGVVVVDVKPGGPDPAAPAAALGHVVAAVSPDNAGGEEQEPKRLGGRLLQQAGRLVRGERLSLAELAGLPENVTVHAQVGSRTLTKSIQL